MYSLVVCWKFCLQTLKTLKTRAAQVQVEACLARIRAGGAPQRIADAWAEQHGVLVRGVSWQRHSAAQLAEVARCVGPAPLAGVCRLLAEDYAAWSGAHVDITT